jgi:hypothetical protein
LRYRLAPRLKYLGGAAVDRAVAEHDARAGELHSGRSRGSRRASGKLRERARELIGYSIHPPFMGYVDGVHPRRLLRPQVM